MLPSVTECYIVRKIGTFQNLQRKTKDYNTIQLMYKLMYDCKVIDVYSCLHYGGSFHV